MTERRFLVRRAVLIAVVAVLGIVLLLLTDGVAAIVGWTIVAIAIVLALSAVFYEVGRSEDRAREAERRRSG